LFLICGCFTALRQEDVIVSKPSEPELSSPLREEPWIGKFPPYYRYGYYGLGRYPTTTYLDPYYRNYYYPHYPPVYDRFMYLPSGYVSISQFKLDAMQRDKEKWKSENKRLRESLDRERREKNPSFVHYVRERERRARQQQGVVDRLVPKSKKEKEKEEKTSTVRPKKRRR